MNEQEKQRLLEQLRDVHLPEVSTFPAPGWWLLVIFTVLVFFAAFGIYKRYRSLQWHRQALHELNTMKHQLDTGQNANDVLISFSRLLKRVMIKIKGRQAVANAHGYEWIVFINNLRQSPTFNEEQMQLLAVGPYQQKPNVDTASMKSILDAAQRLFAELPKINADHNKSL